MFFAFCVSLKQQNGSINQSTPSIKDLNIHFNGIPIKGQLNNNNKSN